jgi:hypothetical protein
MLISPVCIEDGCTESSTSVSQDVYDESSSGATIAFAWVKTFHTQFVGYSAIIFELNFFVETK